MPEFSLRRAEAGDRPLLERMLGEAAQWRPGAARRPLREVLADPLVSRYVCDWPRESDSGWVAEWGPSPPVEFGATWWRFFSAAEPGYGFVDDSIPEVSIAVEGRFRGIGVGRSLLHTLIEDARDQGVPGVSLSVERDNPAIRLYERTGFRAVEEGDGALTMLLALG